MIRARIARISPNQRLGQRNVRWRGNDNVITQMINYNTMKNFLELKNIIDTAENNAAKFYEKGNASTGRSCVIHVTRKS